MRNATEKDTSIFILLIIVLKMYLFIYICFVRCKIETI